VTAVYTVPATLDHWHDADTLVANLDLGWHVGLSKQPIRLARCDAPELATPAGKMALAYVRTLIQPGEKFTLVSHSLDKYGRVLGDVKLADGRDVADTLIANGYALPWDGTGVKP
jgi:micrococcal nuclease